MSETESMGSWAYYHSTTLTTVFPTSRLITKNLHWMFISTLSLSAGHCGAITTMFYILYTVTLSTERRSSIPDALKEYVTRSSTSSRHVACAQSAIGTFEAISLITNAIQSTLKKSYFFDGSSIFSTQLKDRENHTTSHLQDACVIGLILSWCTPSNSKLGERFVWRCCIHQKIQQSVQSEYNKTDQLKRIRFKTVEQCLVTQKLLSLCNFCELQASINAIVSGLALDLLYKDFKADFQIRIYTETDEVGSSLRIDLLSSNWIFSSELFSNLRFSVD